MAKSTKPGAAYGPLDLRVVWDDLPVPGVRCVSGLAKIFEPIPWRTGGADAEIWHAPGLATAPPISLQRPLSDDTRFADWVERVGAGVPEGPQGYLKDVLIELMDDCAVVARITVQRAWPHALRLSDLDLTGDRQIVETLTLRHEGWTLTPAPSAGRHGEVGRPEENPISQDQSEAAVRDGTPPSNWPTNRPDLG